MSSLAVLQLPKKSARAWHEKAAWDFAPLTNLTYGPSLLTLEQQREVNFIFSLYATLFSDSNIISALPPKLFSLPDFESNPGFWILRAGEEILTLYSDGWKKKPWKGGQLCWDLGPQRTASHERVWALSQTLKTSLPLFLCEADVERVMEHKRQQDEASQDPYLFNSYQHFWILRDVLFKKLPTETLSSAEWAQLFSESNFNTAGDESLSPSHDSPRSKSPRP